MAGKTVGFAYQAVIDTSLAKTEEASAGIGVERAVEGRRDVAEDSPVEGSAQRELVGFGEQGPKVTEVGDDRLVLDDVALAFEQGIGMAELDVEARTSRSVHAEHVELGAIAGSAAGGGEAAVHLGGDGTETAPKNEVHDPLVGTVAILESRLLGEDVDPDDRLRREIPDLAETGDPAAVEKDDRPLAAATAAASSLRRQIFEQFAAAAGAARLDLAPVELDLRLDVAENRAALAGAGDDDRFLVAGLVEILVLILDLGIGGDRRFLGPARFGGRRRFLGKTGGGNRAGGDTQEKFRLHASQPQ